MDELMAIGEFSERSGLSPKRLRSYAAAGVLAPAAVDAGTGYRYYAPSQLREARLIEALRRAGMPLAEIASLLREPSLHRLDRWAERIASEAAQRHEALDFVRRVLVSLEEESAGGTPRSKGGCVPTLSASARSETGRTRDNNEDAVLCRSHVVAVADGIGGLPAGEVASSLAIELVDAAYTGASLEELEAVVRTASAAIADRSRSRPDLNGMGTTLCVIGTTSTGDIAVVNVGDSRAYVIRGREIDRLTDDHTVTAELVRRGQLDARSAADHPHRNVLTKIVGGGQNLLDLDGDVHRVRPGDRLLLCTDGLSKVVTDDEMLAIVEARGDRSSAVDALIDLARTRGADDDVTVIVAEIDT